MAIDIRRARAALARAKASLDEAHGYVLPIDHAHEAPLMQAVLAIESAEDRVRAALEELAPLDHANEREDL